MSVRRAISITDECIVSYDVKEKKKYREEEKKN